MRKHDPTYPQTLFLEIRHLTHRSLGGQPLPQACAEFLLVPGLGELMEGETGGCREKGKASFQRWGSWKRTESVLLGSDPEQDGRTFQALEPVSCHGSERSLVMVTCLCALGLLHAP